MDNKVKVHKWLSEGLAKSEIARKLGIARTTLNSQIERWVREGGFILPSKPVDVPEAKEAIKSDRKILSLSESQKVTQRKYKALLEETEEKDNLLKAVEALSKNPRQLKISRTVKKGQNEATVIALFSDWHIEEQVTLDQTNGTNEYNLQISEARAKQCFETLLRLTDIESKNTTIKHVVLGVLGDMISGDIHEDTSKSALLEPIPALVRCRDYLYSGIRYLLENSEYQLTIVCHTGNHGRKDKNQLIANEAGASLEYLMYKYLAESFKDEPRVTFHISSSYHTYFDVYDYTIRFHHGHFIRYGGGIGGLTIPANKAISQWNKLRTADVDCFGHFHTAFDSGYGRGTFVANGSLIGYSAYALSVKGGFQKPMQMMFGVHSKRGKYFTRPILFDV